jgi:hypothetical protein
MKKLTKSEFIERARALKRARKIFFSMRNQTCPECKHEYEINFHLTEAFDAYQKLLAERERLLFIRELTHRSGASGLMDRIQRPGCPKCGQPMMLFPWLDQLTEKENPKGWKTVWRCPDSMEENAPCFYEEYSKKTVADWMNELEKKDHKPAKKKRMKKGRGKCL